MSSPQKIEFVDAVRLGFVRWRDYRTRSSRPEFWWWFLFTVLISIVFGVIDLFLFPAATNSIDPSTLSTEQLQAYLDDKVWEITWGSFFSLGGIASIILFLPSLALTVRRFLDAGAPRWLAFAVELFPLVTLYPVLWMTSSTTMAAITGSTQDQTISWLLIFAITILNLVAFVMWLTICVRKSAK